MGNVIDVQTRVDELAKRLDELSSREQIRECIYRINRGVDRIDRELLASGFHPDAKVQWASPEAVDVATFVETAIKVQHTLKRVHHLVGNILIDLRGDVADVESYEIGRHLTPLKDEKKDLILASRYVDRFSRREGVWRIAHRIKVADWVRVMEGCDPIFDHAPVKGCRDSQDTSFEIFGARAFQHR